MSDRQGKLRKLHRDITIALRIYWVCVALVVALAVALIIIPEVIP